MKILIKILTFRDWMTHWISWYFFFTILATVHYIITVSILRHSNQQKAKYFGSGRTCIFYGCLSGQHSRLIVKMFHRCSCHSNAIKLWRKKNSCPFYPWEIYQSIFTQSRMPWECSGHKWIIDEQPQIPAFPHVLQIFFELIVWLREMNAVIPGTG